MDGLVCLYRLNLLLKLTLIYAKTLVMIRALFTMVLFKTLVMNRAIFTMAIFITTIII